ncbi:MAG: hypothetical protein ABC360_04745 [Acetomicrobium sp.]
MELRRSIWEVLDRKQIVRDVFGGYALPLFSFLPPASPYQAESPVGGQISKRQGRGLRSPAGAGAKRGS